MTYCTYRIAILSRDDLEKLAEDLMMESANIRRLATILHERLAFQFDQRRGKVDGETVTLMFQRGGIDVTEWLGGELLERATNFEARCDSLADYVEAAA